MLDHKKIIKFQKKKHSLSSSKRLIIYLQIDSFLLQIFSKQFNSNQILISAVFRNNILLKLKLSTDVPNSSINFETLKDSCF